MPLWTTLIIAPVVLIAVAVGLARLWQQRRLAKLTAALDAAARSCAAGTGDPQRLAGAPPPVVRYLKHVLPEGRPVIEQARFRQVGELRADLQSERWMEFEATQVVAPAATSFLWNARITVVPFIHLRVLEALIAGAGSSQVSMLSLFPLARSGGSRQLDSGALHRFLAEAVWYPSALLPGTHLEWTAIDDRRALATLTVNGVTVSLEFTFNADDEVAAIFTPARWGTFSGVYRQAAWEGRFGPCVDMGGVLVPGDGEVGWYTSDLWRSVWKGRVVGADFTFRG